MDFTVETQNAMAKIISEKMPEMIEKQASKMVEDIVSDLFRWGDIKNNIKKKIEETININLQEFDLIDYNALISKTINDNLLKQVNLQPILDMTQDIVGFVNKKEISLQEIADMFIEASMEENEQSGDGEITFIVEENSQYGWVEVCADIEPNKDKYECSLKFLFSNKSDSERNGKIFSFKAKDHYYGGRQQQISPIRLINLGNLEHKMFRLYSAQVKITDYSEEINTYWDRY